MYCGKCGTKVQDNARFCGKCGAMINNSHIDLHQDDRPKRNIKIIFAILGVICAVIVLITGIFVLTKGSRTKMMIDTGNQYLAQEKYDRAIVEFDNVLNQDNNCMEAFLGKIYAYKGKNDSTAYSNAYTEAVSVINGMDSQSKKYNSREIALIYLEAVNIYEDNPEKLMSQLECGRQYINSDENIKKQYVQSFKSLSSILTEKNDIINLLSVCEYILELEPDNKEIISKRNMAVTGAVRILVNQGKITEAEDILIQYSKVLNEILLNNLKAEIEEAKSVVGIKKKNIHDSWYEAVHTVEEYDKTGHMIQNGTYWDSDNRIYSYSEYQYDLYGNVINEKRYSSDKKLTSSIDYEYRYDIAGNILERKSYDSVSGYKNVITYDYDTITGNLIKESGEDWTRTYDYDAITGELVKVDYGNSSDTYEYDDNGNQCAVYYSSGTVIKKQYEKDIIKYEAYYRDNEFVGESYYDNNGNVTKSMEYENGDIVWKADFYYDADGQLVKHEEVNKTLSFRRTWTYEYKYDSKGRLSAENIYWSTDGSPSYLKLWDKYEYWD